MILQSIATEKRNIEGARAVIRAFEASSKNETVMQQAQNEIRTATMSIKFLEDELAKLQVDGSGASSGTPGRGEPSGRAGAGVPGRQGPQGIATTSPSGRGMAGDRERPLPPPPPGAEQDNAKKPETKNYSQLGEGILIYFQLSSSSF